MNTHRPKISVEIENISRIVVDRSAGNVFIFNIHESLIRMIQTCFMC